jgi:hypothetical protein
LPLVIVGAVLVAAAVGIPVGIAMGAGSRPTTTSTAPVPRADPVSRTTTSSRDRPPAPRPTPVPPPPAAGSGPAGLTAADAALWDRMTMDGVESGSCAGYPPGEQGFSGVRASLACTIADPSMTEPIIFYQFADAASMDGYLTQRAADVDVSGNCDSGDEFTGNWTADGVRQGRLVCVENVKDGRTLFKLIFSLDRDDTVVVMQDESATDVLAWAHAYARNQFRGV